MIEIKDDYLGKDTIMKGVDEGLEAVQTHGAAFISILWIAVKGIIKYYEDSLRLVTKYPQVIKSLVSVWVDSINQGIKNSMVILESEKEFCKETMDIFAELQKNDKIIQKMIEAIEPISSSFEDRKPKKTEAEMRYDSVSDVAYRARIKYECLRDKYFNHEDNISLEEVANAKIELSSAEEASNDAWEQVYNEKKKKDDVIKDFIESKEEKPQEVKKVFSA